MGDESIYFATLRRFSSITSGSNDFEKISRILIKFMYPSCDFKVPEGGLGTKDGGYDGYDTISKTKLACSIQENYEKKIKDEIKKSKKNGDLKLIYFSNQKIPEPEKNRIKADPDNRGIELDIYGIDVLSREIENHFKKQSDPELYDLLCLSFLRVGECYQRGDAKPFNIYYNSKIYKKKILISESNIYRYSNSLAEIKTGDNPLLDFMLSCCSGKNQFYFNNITLCGIGYLGKSFLMKTTFNALIKEFSDKKNYEKYSHLPFIIFRELKYYRQGDINKLIENNVDPIYVFLDGLDELNESKKIELNSEIQNIQRDNDRVRFIISGRNSSFIDFDIFSNSFQLYLEKYIDPNDIELLGLIEEYKNTPIADLLPIPTYRNFVFEKKISINSKLEEFYALLVKENLSNDKERTDHSNAISSRMVSNINIDSIIEIISEFCYGLFLDNKRVVFTEKELKNYLSNENDFIFFMNSSIIDYHDINNVSFVSNFYYEYFVANALLFKHKKVVIKHFFPESKIRISLIDIFVLFLDLAKSKNKKLYNRARNRMLKNDVVCILLCEFDSIADNERFKYFVSIFNEYKRIGKYIYYGRFYQDFGPLKNINNMAMRMQQLLPTKYKKEAVNFLKMEIFNFLNEPSQDDVLSFGNAVVLLIPFIDELWSEEQQLILKEMSLPLIRFFVNDDLSNQLNNLLSERFVIDWYKKFNWIAGWRQNEWIRFYEDISNIHCNNLVSEIVNEDDYAIKFILFSIFYKEDVIRPLLFPLFRYIIKNKRFSGVGTAITVPDMISDDYGMPLIQKDDRVFLLSHILQSIEVDVSDIIDLLNFAIENNVYGELKDAHYYPLKILEEKLYANITLLKDVDYEKFASYYLNTDKHGFDDRLFKNNVTKNIEKLNMFIVCKIISNEITKWKTTYYLHKMINFSDADISLNYLRMIKDKVHPNIYSDVVHYIYNNKEHILQKSTFIACEYNALFEKEIIKKREKEKKIEDINNELELKRKKDIELIQNTEAMIDELNKINDFLLGPLVIDDEKTARGKLFSLNYRSINDLIMYSSDEKIIPPIFSECAINIMIKYYRHDVVDINKIINHLKNYLFKEENFYYYFYYYYVEKSENVNDNKDKCIDVSIFSDVLIKRIIDSMNMDVFGKFSNKDIKYFEQYSKWLKPFFYYCETLLNNSYPVWLQVNHILKLIVVPDPCIDGLTSVDMSLDWVIKRFPSIKPCQLIEYGLDIIENVTSPFSRIQIVKYFINYYNSIDQDILTDRIMDFIIDTTKKLFNLTEVAHIYSEFQYINQFWEKSNLNCIDRLFQKFTVETIISAIRKQNNDIDFQYRKGVLLYCSKVATIEQKTRIIRDVETDFAISKLSDKESDEVHGFLASLGSEKSIKYIISSYLNDKPIKNRYSNNYTLGVIEQNDDILKLFIDLFIYSTEKVNERRDMLLNIAQSGIRQHLSKKNFKYFRKRMIREMKNLKKQSRWQVEFYDSFLLKMQEFICF